MKKINGLSIIIEGIELNELLIIYKKKKKWHKIYELIEWMSENIIEKAFDN